MKKYFKESVLLVWVVLPYIFLALIWKKLPDEVAIHFDYRGQANGYATKTLLLLVPAGLGLLIYLLLLCIPYFDPKKRIGEMGEKYYSLRMIMGIFISILSMYLLYLSKAGSMENTTIMFCILGVLIAIMGNYFQTVRPNYFIGIRTPWTLENEHVWKKTHALGGWLWMIGGSLIVFLSLATDLPRYALYTIIGVISLVPIVYSYLEFEKQKKRTGKLSLHDYG